MVGRGVCGDDAGMLRAGLGHDRPGARWSVHPDNRFPACRVGLHRAGADRRSTRSADGQRRLLARKNRCHQRHRPKRRSQPRRSGRWRSWRRRTRPRRSVAIQQPQLIPLRRRVGRMVSHLVPTAANGGGARPLGGLVHRAGAACRASGAGTIGGSSRRRTPCRCPTSTSQYGQHRRIQRCSGLRRAVSQIPGASRQTGGRARLASLGRCLPDFRATPERRPGVRWKLWMPKFVPTPANVWRAS